MLTPVLLPQLPDGQELQFGPDRFRVPELLFNPVRLSRPPQSFDLVLAGSLPVHPLAACTLYCGCLFAAYRQHLRRFRRQVRIAVAGKLSAA